MPPISCTLCAPAILPRWAARALVAGLATATLAGCAAAEPYNPGHLAPDELARVGQTCEAVLRVHPREQHYDACVESLSGSLVDARQVGLAPSPQVGGGAPATGISSKSYFSASADELRRREQRSCVQLGLASDSGGFAGCVTNLAGALHGIDMPPLN